MTQKARSIRDDEKTLKPRPISSSGAFQPPSPRDRARRSFGLIGVSLRASRNPVAKRVLHDAAAPRSREQTLHFQSVLTESPGSPAARVVRRTPARTER